MLLRVMWMKDVYKRQTGVIVVNHFHGTYGTVHLTDAALLHHHLVIAYPVSYTHLHATSRSA